MKWDKIFIGLVAIFLVLLFVLYMVFPTQEIQFGTDRNNNFSLEKNNVSMQFYENMRFPSPEISYSINEECTLQKKGEMIEAFELVSNVTDLNFFEDLENPQISIDCDEKSKMEEGLFIAGEGGPTKIIPGDQFNVILLGRILLIRNSNCQRPNVAIHELLHVLGFDHSNNTNNIMYPVSKCKQTIGDEIPLEINRVYSTASLPDLKFEEVVATVNGRMLDINMSIKNDGLVSSKGAKIIILGGNKIVKEIELDPLEIGYEVKISLTNVWTTKLKIEELMVSIESNYTELSKENNKISLTKSQ